MLSEQNDEWSVGKRYMGSESLAKASHRPIGRAVADETVLDAAGAA